MKYSIFVIVCLTIHTVINLEIFRKKATVSLPAIKAYRIFVGSIAAYFLVDLLWGIFEENKLANALYIDTTIYFVVMGFTILAWARYIVRYMKSEGWFSKAALIIGNLFFLAEIILLIINIFTPILFTVDKDCVYEWYKARNIMLYVQILIYILLLIYTIVKVVLAKSNLRRRYIAIGAYSLIMGSAISIQIYYPYLPLYSIGCVVGSALIYSFVINDIKEEYKTQLAESRVMVQEEQIKLNETMVIAYTDPLTNVRNKHAYVEEEDCIDKLISKGEMEDFAVVVFDLNNLKTINDKKGHEAGDAYIIESCRTIEKYFGNENIYRFGGDEFVAILTKETFQNRNKIMADFESFIDSCVNTDKPVISSGMSSFRKKTDNTYHAVFYRADRIMYSRKDVLKEQQNNQ